MRCAALIVALGLLSAARAGEPAPRPTADGEAFFEARVRPILAENCLKCHGPEAQKSGLRLDSRRAAIEGGDSGPAIVPGKPEESPLVEAIRHEGAIQMPPKKMLPPAAIADLESWIKMGAPWPAARAGQAEAEVEAWRRHWAFQPVRAPALPAVKDGSWPRTTADRFILARLEEKGLTPSPRADRRTLIRRASFDLTGLPPSPEEVERFNADERPEAYAELIDRLLASPHYGERWGRYWLDVARYADTKGYVFFEDGNFPWAYTYRDYVVRSLNEDRPYDRFLVEQIAADKLDLGADRRPLAALGFLTLGGRFMNNRHDIIDDRIDVVTRGLMALTVTCARCHDHKYDPIPTADYYSLYGVFASTTEPDVPPLFEPPPESKQYADFAAELAAREGKLDAFIRSKHDELVASSRRRAADYMLAAHAARKQPTTEEFMLIAEGDDLNPLMLTRWKSYLERTSKPQHPVFAPWHALAMLPADGFAERAASALAQLGSARDRPINPLVLRALDAEPPQSLADAAKTYARLLNHVEPIWQDWSRRAALNGDGHSPLPDPALDELRRVFHGPDAPPDLPLKGTSDLDLLPDRPSQAKLQELRKAVETWRANGPGAPPRAMVLVDSPRPVEPRIFRRGNPNNHGPTVPRQFLAILSGPDRRPFHDGSGRLELARAIADPSNPLTARALVNRVWMQHFGSPLVATPSDFGLRSEPPTHPELLDHLASTFMAEGWSLKALHRRIMLSAAYQQASADRPECLAVDPENALLWKMNRRRLDFESTRDALLASTGRLDRSIGGPPFKDLAAPATPRRTLYGFIDRLNLPGLFRTFDFPDPSATSPRRDRTTVPPQALFLMNNPFVLEAARTLASRPEIASGPDLPRKVERLYRLLFARRPTPDESSLALNFLGPAPPTAAWERLAQALLMSNEFVFID